MGEAQKIDNGWEWDCLVAERDALQARVAELEAVIRESIRNHRIGCPCPRCEAVGGVLGKTTNPAISIQTGI